MILWKNHDFVFQFDEITGCIDSLRDKRREYIGEKTEIFKIGLMDKEGNQSQEKLDNLKLLSSRKDVNGFSVCYGNLEMEVTVQAEIKDEIRWTIVVERKDDKVVEWVDFPRIAVPDELRDNQGNSRILWGFNEGGIVDDMTYKENSAFSYRDLQYPSISAIPMYPAIVETQFLSYYDEIGGLYLGSHDKEDQIKGFDFTRLGKGILLQIRHFTGSDFGVKYEMGYPVVMKFFDGDWQDAAQIYKNWFLKEKSRSMIPIQDNMNLPDWYGESPVVITYPVRGRHDGDIMNPNKLFPYIEGMKHIERLEKELNSTIMVILMHWEGTAPWAPPYVWPPFGGEEELKKFVDTLHKRGDMLGVYCSGMGWTQYSKRVEHYHKEKEFEENHLHDVMCLSPKQELPYCNIVPDIRAGYDMCPSQKFTVDVLKEQVKHMVDAGIDYIQLLDQNHGGTSYFCYSRNHGHPPVPGKWQVEAVQNLLTVVENNTGKVLFGCESAAAESYIPWLLFSDNRYHLNFACGHPVPLYAYMYHEYVNNFMGNQVCANGWLDHKRSPENLLERLAYSFMAGDMLTLVLNENGEVSWNWGWREIDDIPDQESVLTFVRNANQWRRGIGKKYLHTGTMRKPYPVVCDKNILYGSDGHEFLTDRIYTSAWEAYDGSYGQFLINCHPVDVECQISLPEGNYQLYEDEDHMQIVSGGKKKITVKKLSAVMLEKGNEYTVNI